MQTSRRKLLALTVALSIVTSNPVVNTYVHPACMPENLTMEDTNDSNKENVKTKNKKRCFA